jgi:hypothetical protein
LQVDFGTSPNFIIHPKIRQPAQNPKKHSNAANVPIVASIISAGPDNSHRYISTRNIIDRNRPIN